MSDPRTRTQNDWLDLFNAVIDGTISADAFAQLEAALLEDSALRTLFVRYTNLHAGTRRYSTEKKETAKPESYPIYRKGYEPKPKSAIGNRQLAIFSALAAALLIACGIGVYIFVSSLPHSELPDPTSTAPLANLIENASEGTLTTPGGFISEGRDYGRGTYALDRGTAEFMLTNSVNVKLRGESRLYMRNNMSVSLTHGSAEFVCPTDAKGFTVHLPDKSKIVDLGTAFRIEVDDDGQTTLRVTEGSVEWISSRSDTDPVLIVAGRTANISDGQISLPRDVQLAIVNAGFESDAPGSEGASGWKIATGGEVTEFWTTDGAGLGLGPSDSGPDVSRHYLTANSKAGTATTNPASSTASQNIDLSAFATNIDSGTVTADVDFLYNCFDAAETASVTITFHDASGSPIGSKGSTGPLAHTTAKEWVAATIEDGALAVPIGARRLTIMLHASRSAGGGTNVSFDNIRLTLRNLRSDRTADSNLESPLTHDADKRSATPKSNETPIPTSGEPR